MCLENVSYSQEAVVPKPDPKVPKSLVSLSMSFMILKYVNYIDLLGSIRTNIEYHIGIFLNMYCLLWLTFLTISLYNCSIIYISLKHVTCVCIYKPNLI